MLSRGQEQQPTAGDTVSLLRPAAAALEVAPPGSSSAQGPRAEAGEDAEATTQPPAAKRLRMEPPASQMGSFSARAAEDSLGGSAQLLAQRPAAPARPPPVVLVLCGVQGAGKSTFALALVQQGQGWVRVNQDSVASGSRGSRDQCLAATKAALAQGSNVVIDRTNVTAEQRAFFVKLARQAGAAAHCLVLDLPPKVCGARAAGRQNHEGGLSGNRAYSVVGMTHKALKEAGPPRQAEGFATVCVCEGDADVAAALHAWAAYGPGHTEPWVAFESGRPAKSSKLPGGLQPIDKFFQRKLDNQQRQQQPAAAQGGASTSGINHASGAAPGHSKAAPLPLLQQQQQQQQQQQPHKSANAFDVLMTAAKHSPPPPPPTVRPHPGSSAAAGGSKHTFPATHFINALTSYADQPERHPGVVVHQDESCVLIQDKYPKARYHALVISRLPRLQGPLDLQGPQGAALVRHMLDVGRRWAAEHGGGAAFRFGFHSAPSMRRLHLHVISQDLDSPCLKTKVHWNSFTTPFFMDADGVALELEVSGALQYDVSEREALLKTPLRCHRCGASSSTMPALKAHVGRCAAPLPGG